MSQIIGFKAVKADLTSRDGFQYPSTGLVTAPDFANDTDFGHGLHFWTAEQHDFSACCYLDRDCKYLILSANNAIYLGGKYKARALNILEVLSLDEIVKRYPGIPFDYSTVSGGDYSTVSGGRSSTVSGGDYSTVSGGDYSTVSGGAYSTVSGGAYSTVSGGDCSTFSGGDCSTVSGGADSTVSGRDYSTVSGRDYSIVSGGAYSTVSGRDYSTVSGRDYSTVSGGDYSTVSGGADSTVSGGVGSTLLLRGLSGVMITFLVTKETIGVKFGLDANDKFYEVLT